MGAELRQKYDRLLAALGGMGSVMVAFSGGVDSTLLAYAAYSVLGESACALTVDSPYHSSSEISAAVRTARTIGISHLILKISLSDVPEIISNPEDRCYQCKRKIFARCLEIAAVRGFKHVVDGSNVDDLSEHRPGKKALSELCVRSPLQEAGLTKTEIRALSREFGLNTWNVPSRTCLLTRFPYGEKITKEALERVESCEEFLRQKCFSVFRVRCHGRLARIEVGDEEMVRLMEETMRTGVNAFFRQHGFDFVSMDLSGYRTGSMDRLPV